jgi:hypothetical protein
MPVIINILPNVYWLYNNPLNPINIDEYKFELRKFGNSIGVKTVLELDDKLTFWHKCFSYINEIKVEMEKNEFAKLLTLLKKLNEIILNSYTKNSPLIISIYNQQYFELGLAIWIYFFNINGSVSFDNVIKLMGYKIIGNIMLTEQIKKFFAFINLDKISGKI